MVDKASKALTDSKVFKVLRVRMDSRVSKVFKVLTAHKVFKVLTDSKVYKAL